MSITINFYDSGGVFSIANDRLKFAVIAARYQGKWIFCRHKQRDTYEIPGGHREPGEDINDTARRELQEETGAISFDLAPVCIYSVTLNEVTTYGKLFFADVSVLGELPQEMEIKEIILADNLPERLTYPAIQPHLFKRVREWLIRAS
ncbi:MAG: NUDIX hydrolase [Bacillota bacterium]|jgi:8-oxo-dGTP diphosphatase